MSAGADQSLDLIIENMTYQYDTEHLGAVTTISTGKTLIGDLNKTYFRYHLSEDVSADAGAILNMPFGFNGGAPANGGGIQTAAPHLAIRYEFFPGFRIVAGSIENDHPMHDALYYRTLQYSNPNERGFQFRGFDKFVDTDFWINWKNFETPTTNETFDVGLVLKLKYAGFMADVETIWNHSGGQLNTGGNPSQDINWLYGLGYHISPAKHLGKPFSWFQDIGYELNEIQTRNLVYAQPRLKGLGFENRAYAQVFHTLFYFKTWSRHNLPDFKAVEGDPLYKSAKLTAVGMEKWFWITRNVRLQVSFTANFLYHTMAHENMVTLEWRGDFPLFSNYFKELNKENESNGFAGSLFPKGRSYDYSVNAR